jgi:hypothetical protein
MDINGGLRFKLKFLSLRCLARLMRCLARLMRCLARLLRRLAKLLRCLAKSTPALSLLTFWKGSGMRIYTA